MRSIHTILIIFLIKSFSAIAQQDSIIGKDRFFIIEDIPSFQGHGLDSIRKYIDENLIYPKYAYDRDIMGKVFIQFTIDFKGQVRDAYVLKGVDLSIDYAAYKTIENMPRWTPGKARGRNNPITFTFPVVFDTKKINHHQIRNVYDKQIEYLLTLDSLSLDSLLYRKKATLEEEERIQYIEDTISQILYISKDTLINKTISTNGKSEKPEIHKGFQHIANYPLEETDCQTYNIASTNHEKGYKVLGKIELEDYLNCVRTDTNLTLIDIILNDTLYIYPSKDGGFSFNSITDSISYPVVKISFNNDTGISNLGYDCYFEDFSIYLPLARNNIILLEVHLLKIRPLTPENVLWNTSLNNRFKNKKLEKLKRIIFYVPGVLKKVIVLRVIRNRHFTYKFEDTKAVYKSVKIDSNDYGNKYILDGKYCMYYNTGELKAKGKIRMGECVGIWKVYSKKKEVIATYDFTKDITIYNWIKDK